MEELYVLADDPDQVQNVAGNLKYRDVKSQLKSLKRRPIDIHCHTASGNSTTTSKRTFARRGVNITCRSEPTIMIALSLGKPPLEWPMLE